MTLSIHINYILKVYCLSVSIGYSVSGVIGKSASVLQLSFMLLISSGSLPDSSQLSIMMIISASSYHHVPLGQI